MVVRKYRYYCPLGEVEAVCGENLNAKKIENPKTNNLNVSCVEVEMLRIFILVMVTEIIKNNSTPDIIDLLRNHFRFCYP